MSNEDRWIAAEKDAEEKDFPVQTRSEETGLGRFKTIAEGLAHMGKDQSVWKLSFSLGNERVILERDYTRNCLVLREEFSSHSEMEKD